MVNVSVSIFPLPRQPNERAPTPDSRYKVFDLRPTGEFLALQLLATLLQSVLDVPFANLYKEEENVQV